jgi:RNA polymerase sigma factor (sigma-70 family)
MAYLRGLLSQERADDALQQTFVKAHAAIVRDDRIRSPRAWLYRIAHNTAANLIRDTARPDEPLPEHVASVELPEEVASRRHTFSEVLSAVQSLPLRQRDAIVLRELEGRSYEEIAGELGVTDGAVRALLNRARTSIRSSVTALTPVDLLARILVPVADSPVPAVCKVCAAVAVTGAAAGGAVPPAPQLQHERAVRSNASAVVTTPAAARPPAARPAPVRRAAAQAAPVRVRVRPARPRPVAQPRRATEPARPRRPDARYQDPGGGPPRQEREWQQPQQQPAHMSDEPRDMGPRSSVPLSPRYGDAYSQPVR